MQHEAADRAVEQVVYEAVEQKTLGFTFFRRRAIDMFHLTLISDEESFFRHQLHQFQCGGILDLASVLIQPFIDETDSIGSMLPEYLEDLQFRSGGFDTAFFPSFFSFHSSKVGNFSYSQ